MQALKKPQRLNSNIRMQQQEPLLSIASEQEVIAAIKQAELRTSGEIRLHVEPACKGDAYARALEVFGSLGMHKTKERNAVLFYFAITDRKFSVVGDEGIHAKVKDDFWIAVRDAIQSNFREGNFVPGLVKGIEMAGEKLSVYFPRLEDDSNELSDDISIGN
jgi:uncharacterized membrane protein